MDRRKNRGSFILFSGALALASAVGYGVYNYYHKSKSEKLNKWLEDYIKEIEPKIKAEQETSLSPVTIASIVNLVTEIEEYLYLRDYSDIELKRISKLKTQEYESAVNQTIELHEKTFLRASKIVEKALNVNINDLKEILDQQTDSKKLRELIEVNQKDYEQYLPKIEKETLKKAFLAYSAQLIQQDKVVKNMFNFAKLRPEFREKAIDIFNLNRYVLKDSIQKEFNINEKYFYQLLVKHDLLNDSEVKAQRDFLKNL
jgi:hypothetical protein